MASLTAAVLTSLLNLAVAAYVYLSLRGWFVPHEPSGIQLIIHGLVTAPVALGTSMWLYFLSQAKKCSRSFWEVNILTLLVPIINFAPGVLLDGHDKIGLFVICIVAATLLLLYTKQLWRHARS